MNKHILAIDTETTGLSVYHGDRPFIVSTCDLDGNVHCYSAPVDPQTREPHWSDRCIREIRQLIDDSDEIVFHNAIFDLEMLDCLGIHINWSRVHDTVAMSHALDTEESHALKDLSVKYLYQTEYGTYDDEIELKRRVVACRRAASSRGIPLGPSVETDYWLPRHLDKDDTSCEHYAVYDAVRTILLFEIFRKALEEEQLQWQYERERDILEPTYRMRRNGVRLCRYTLPDMRASFQADSDSCTKRMREVTGVPDFNPASYPQLRIVLFEHPPHGFSLPIYKFTESSQPSPSTDVEILKRLSSEVETDLLFNPNDSTLERAAMFLEAMIRFRKMITYKKYLRNYEELAVPVDNELRLYPHFNPTGTRFTRFSCSSPNLQNVGARDEDNRLRAAFGPSQSWIWLCFDYDQLELRIGATLSGDRRMLEALAAGKDLHQITADTLSIPRKQGKNINFAWWYGAKAAKLSKMAGMPADEFEQAMATAYPAVVDFMQQTIAQVETHRCVYTAGGYRIPIDYRKPYIGTNAVVQGTAGDIAKRAMIDIHRYLKEFALLDDIRAILNVHDELVFECRRSVIRDHPEILGHIKYLMESAGQFIQVQIETPVNVERCDRNWAESRPLEVEAVVPELMTPF